MFSHPRRPNWRILLSSTLARDSPTTSVRAWNDEIALEKRFITTRSERFSSLPTTSTTLPTPTQLAIISANPELFSARRNLSRPRTSGRVERLCGVKVQATRDSKCRVKVQKSLDEVQSTKMCRTHTNSRMLSEKRTQKNIILKNVFFFAFEYRKVSQNCSHEVTERNFRHPRLEMSRTRRDKPARS